MKELTGGLPRPVPSSTLRVPVTSDPAVSAVGARLDYLPWNRFHSTALAVLGVGWALDAFEVTLISSIIGILSSQWHLDPNQMSWIFGVWFLGLMIGAAAFGLLADRFGRKRIFLASLLLYGSFTAVTALAPTYSWLLGFRLATAVGVGAEYAAINAAISELIPARNRGRTGALVMNFWPAGAILAALLSLALITWLPQYLAWRLVFAFGALIALATTILRRNLPESPRWLERQGHEKVASHIVDGIARGITHFPDAFSNSRPAIHFSAKPLTGIITLLRDYPGRLALGCALDFAEAAGYYGLFALLPLVVLPELKLPESELPFFYLLGNIGALGGGLAVAWLLERVGRKSTVMACYGFASLSMVGLSVVCTWGTIWIITGFVVANLFATASWIGAYPTFTELFPTSIRSTGVGVSVAVGRIGALISPFAITALGSKAGPGAASILLASFWLLGFVGMAIWARLGIEACGKPLEALVSN